MQYVFNFQTYENIHAKSSGGYILLFNFAKITGEVSYLLVRPTNNNKFEIPGGRVELSDRSLLDGAIREFSEETGYALPRQANYIPLGQFRGRKKIKYCWALEGDIPDTHRFTSNLTSKPVYNKRTGVFEHIPEIEKWKWHSGLDKLKHKAIEDDSLFFLNQFKNYLKESGYRSSLYEKYNSVYI